MSPALAYPIPKDAYDASVSAREAAPRLVEEGRGGEGGGKGEGGVDNLLIFFLFFFPFFSLLFLVGTTPWL